MRTLLQATVSGLSFVCLLCGGGAGAEDGATTDVWLRQGADLSVSAAPDDERIVFGLIGRVWLMHPQDGFATQLSDDDETARGPVLSPDGRMIAYETVRDGFHQIMVRDADGSLPRQVTFGDFNHRWPSWSRSSPARPFDGNRLIMSSDRGGRFGVWEIDVATLDLQQLTFASHDEREPAWSADGTQLAYVTDTDDGTALYAVRPGEQPELLLTEKARMRAPAWRPGGGLVTYVRQLHGENQLRMLLLSEPSITKPISSGENVFPYPALWLDRSRYLYTADGHIRRRRFGERNAETVSFNARLELTHDSLSQQPLTFGMTENQPVVGNNGWTVADDGRYIVATLGDLWELRPDATLLRQLTNDPYVDAYPALSPDVAQLAFVSDRGGSLQIWLQDMESKELRRMTRESGVALQPRWAQDGNSIDYLAAEHVAASEFVHKRINVESRIVEIVAEPDDDPANAAPGDSDRGDAPAVPLTWRPFVVEGRKIIRAARIFDGMGPGYLTEHEIVIEGDRIVAVRPWSSQSDDDAAGGDEIIDASNQTVMPGLIDMSVHQTRIADERLGRKFLAYGVTTIRESVDNPPEAIERRESWGSGRRIGPRLLMTSTPCTDDPGGFVVTPVLEPAVAQPAFRERISAAIDRGSVSIGVCPALNASTRVDLIATVHARGLPAMTTEAFPDVLLGANETRMPSPELAGYDDFAIVTGTLRTTVTTNLAPTGLPLLVNQGEFTTGWQYRQLFTTAEHDWYERNWVLPDPALAEHRVRSQAVARGLVAALGRGARVVTGSDASRVPPGMGMQAELRLLTRAGLQPFQALRMATHDAGRALGAGERLGVIRPGALADLVIVDGDPLEDIRDAANISMTIVGGRPYTLRELSSPGSRPASVGNLYN